MGSMSVQCFAPQQECYGVHPLFEPGSLWWSLHGLPVSMWVSSEYFGFLPLSKDVRLTPSRL